jgi:hypothetical protein
MVVGDNTNNGGAYQHMNTPLRPSQEGNRTFPRFFSLVNT